MARLELGVVLGHGHGALLRVDADDAARWFDAVEHRVTAAPAWIEALAALTARTGMRQFAVMANVYRGRLGDDAALTAARLLAAEIENPALSTVLGAPLRA
jgi:hypothetical protein